MTTPRKSPAKPASTSSRSRSGATKSTAAPRPKAPANPTATRLAAQGLAAPKAATVALDSETISASELAGAALPGGAENPLDDAMIPGATDDLDITMIAQEETERARRRAEAEARNAATFNKTDPDPTTDYDAPLAMPDLRGYVLFECPGKGFLEITVGPNHDVKFKNHRYRTNDQVEIELLRGKKLRQRHGIFEATSDGITEDLFWSAKGTFWHSDAARLEYDRINLPGQQRGDLRNPWPA